MCVYPGGLAATRLHTLVVVALLGLALGARRDKLLPTVVTFSASFQEGSMHWQNVVLLILTLAVLVVAGLFVVQRNAGGWNAVYLATYLGLGLLSICSHASSACFMGACRSSHLVVWLWSSSSS